MKDANTISYEFTVDDPASFTRPWTARSAFRARQDHSSSAACQEANYSMSNILSGARFQERQKSRGNTGSRHFEVDNNRASARVVALVACGVRVCVTRPSSRSLPRCGTMKNASGLLAHSRNAFAMSCSSSAVARP